MFLKNKFSFLKIIQTSVVSFLVLASLAGCAKAPPEPQAPSYFDHTVKFQGETLAVIAAWYTGSAKNWEVLAAANPQLKPNRIQIGDVIHIPQEMITRFEPLQKKSLKKAATAPSTEEKKEKEPTKSAEEKKDEPSPQQPTEQKEVAPAAISNDSAAAPVAVQPATPDPGDEMVSAFEENLVIEPTPVTESATPAPPAPTLSAEEKAREDLIDEILRK